MRIVQRALGLELHLLLKILDHCFLLLQLLIRKLGWGNVACLTLLLPNNQFELVGFKILFQRLLRLQSPVLWLSGPVFCTPWWCLSPQEPVAFFSVKLGLQTLSANISVRTSVHGWQSFGFWGFFDVSTLAWPQPISAHLLWCGKVSLFTQKGALTFW